MKLLSWIKSLFSRSTPQGELTKTEGIALTGDRVKKFTEPRLGGQNAPKDLGTLLVAIAGDPEFEERDNNPLKIIGAKVLWANRKYPLWDHKYINDADRTDLSDVRHASCGIQRAVRILCPGP